MSSTVLDDSDFLFRPADVLAEVCDELASLVIVVDGEQVNLIV